MSLLTSATTGLVGDADHVELSRLITEFAWRIDHRQAATLTEIVTEDAELRIDPDSPVVGHDAIRAWGEEFDRTDPLPGIRHFVSNVRLRDEGGGRASGVSQLIAFHTPEGERPTTGPYAFGEDHDSFRRTPEGWKLASRRWVPLALR